MLCGPQTISPQNSPLNCRCGIRDTNRITLQGTLVSLIHPALMDFLFLSTLWTGYLGWQWRRTRTIPEELKQLKKELPEKDAEGNRPVSKVDGRIAALEEVRSAQALIACKNTDQTNNVHMFLQQRKLMSKKEYKGRHHNWGGLIMGLGTATAVAGPVNTYLRSGMQLCLHLGLLGLQCCMLTTYMLPHT